MNLKRHALSGIILLAVHSPGAGQDTLNFSTILAARVAALEKLSPDSDPSWKPAWINDIEVRTETDRFDPDRQEYLLRFNFNSPGLVKAQKNYFASLQAKYGADRNENLNKLVRGTYSEWLDAVFLQKKSALLEENRSILEDEMQVRQKMVANSEKDLAEYLDLKQEIRECDLQLSGCRFRKAELLDRMVFPGGADQSYQSFDDRLVTLGQIEAYINRLQLDGPASNATAEAGFRYRKVALETELAAELAESRQIVDFLQFRYRGPHDDRLSERLSAGLGLRVPLNGKNRLKVAELKQAIVSLDHDRQLEQFAFSTIFVRRLAEIRLPFDQYRLLEQQLNELESEFRTVSTRANSTGSPVWLLNIRKAWNKARIRKIEIEKEIYKEYVELLDLTGALQWDSARNFLEETPEE
ncbi:MAG TPA: hypothetical protein PKE06_06425 [Flavilitoribacter sp.]|mgnify:CR=1 FL=1|nr:hypothetical protein [Flavilitoribacter sp.]HMQ86774.1 hypothetical protein [Flavilitoribacter sp.]